MPECNLNACCLSACKAYNFFTFFIFLSVSRNISEDIFRRSTTLWSWVQFTRQLSQRVPETSFWAASKLQLLDSCWTAAIKFYKIEIYIGKAGECCSASTWYFIVFTPTYKRVWNYCVRFIEEKSENMSTTKQFDDDDMMMIFWPTSIYILCLLSSFC